MKNEEIDLQKIYRAFILNIKSIIYISVLSFFMGLIIYFILPKKYQSTITFSLSQPSNNNVDPSISNIASLAGFNFNDKSESLNPAFYPKILEDINVKRKILNIELDSNLILGDYLLFGKFISDNNLNLSENVEEISEKEFYLFKKLDEIISIDVDEKLALISIVSEINNPLYSFLITRDVYNILQSKIIKLNSESSNNILNFINKNYNQKKSEFYKIQEELSSFKDQNQSVATSKFSDEKFRIENEFNLKFNIYNELSKELELTKIEINKNTPIFMILSNPFIPYKKSSPSIMIILIFFLTGFILSSIYHILKDDLKIFLSISENLKA